MIDRIEALCALPGVSGREDAVRAFIEKEIASHCEVKTDPLGNLIAFKKGAARPRRRVLLDAHMDEVGLFITGVTDSGLLRFATAGGIDPKVLHGRRVKVGNRYGVIGVKPVHLMDEEERRKPSSAAGLLIDIGAKDKEEALNWNLIGETAVFDSRFLRLGDKITGKALDDRIGCALLMEMIGKEQPYDLWFSFSVQEELGTRGAKTAAFSVDPDCAVVVETTTAADIPGVEEGKRVCLLGNGPAVSFLDGGTCYDRELYSLCFAEAEKAGIPIQPKAAATGGNNAQAIHVNKGGVRTLALSIPCRYLHGPYGMADVRDIAALSSLLPVMAARMAE